MVSITSLTVPGMLSEFRLRYIGQAWFIPDASKASNRFSFPSV